MLRRGLCASGRVGPPELRILAKIGLGNFNSLKKKGGLKLVHLMKRLAAAAFTGAALVIVILVSVNNPSQKPDSLANTRTIRLTSSLRPTRRITLNVSSQPKERQDLIAQNLMFCCVRDGNDLHNLVRRSRCLARIAHRSAKDNKKFLCDKKLLRLGLEPGHYYCPVPLCALIIML